MATLAFGFPIDMSGGPHLSDVPQGSTFYPDNDATRAQISKIVYLTVNYSS